MDKKRNDPGPASLWDEIRTGMLVGMAACLVITLGLHGGALAILLSAPAGMVAGAVIGLLLWAEQVTHPDELVRPPARSEERGHRHRR